MTDSKKLSSHSHSLTIGFDGSALFRKVDGIGRYTYNLIDAYAQEFPDYNIVIVGFTDDDKSSCDLFKKHSNIHLAKIPLPRRLYQAVYSRLFRIPMDIFLPKIDCYISTNFTRYPYIRNTTCLTVIHDIAYLHYPEVIESRNLAFLRKHIPKSLQEDRIIASSEFTKREIETHLGTITYPISTVLNGYSEEFSPPTKRSDETFILTVGTIEPRKNLKSLLAAYAELPVDIQEKYPLRVVGNGGWGDTAAPEQYNVSYTGYVSDTELIQLYQQASLFVFPSIYEGFGLPVLEALATGTKVACSDIPPLRDIAGNQATYFNPAEPQSITDAILRSLQRPYSHQDIPQHFTWTNSAKQLDAVIRKSL